MWLLSDSSGSVSANGTRASRHPRNEQAPRAIGQSGRRAAQPGRNERKRESEIYRPGEPEVPGKQSVVSFEGWYQHWHCEVLSPEVACAACGVTI